jgi:hypothetical protein
MGNCSLSEVKRLLEILLTRTSLPVEELSLFYRLISLDRIGEFDDDFYRRIPDRIEELRDHPIGFRQILYLFNLVHDVPWRSLLLFELRMAQDTHQDYHKINAHWLFESQPEFSSEFYSELVLLN